MGNFAESCANKYQFSREDQDAYAIESLRRANTAIDNGWFDQEIAPVTISSRRGDVVVDTDEQPGNAKPEKIPQLRPAFDKNGTVTAANASSISDGAAALTLMMADEAEARGLKPIALIHGFDQSAHEPEWFTTAPSKAIPKALSKANISISDVDYFELNEAFSVVGLANIKILGLNPEKVNINGGAVSLGHPLGMSGARIVIALTSILKQKNAKFGAAGICNGGAKSQEKESARDNPPGPKLKNGSDQRNH